MKKFWKFLMEFLATGGFLGKIPFASGTFGTLLGVLIFWLISEYTLVYYLLIISMIPLSILISDYAQKNIYKGENDPKVIVIDEITGYLVSTIGFVFSPSAQGIFILVTTFIIFRILDIFKPFPIVHLQKLEGGVGIVIDDIFAGIVTNILTRILLTLNITSTLFPINHL
jgi:phosphatidylglycerophosphatase A